MLDDVAQKGIHNSVADDDTSNYAYLLSTHGIVQEQRAGSESLRLLTSNAAYFVYKVENAELVHVHSKICVLAHLHMQLLT